MYFFPSTCLAIYTNLSTHRQLEEKTAAAAAAEARLAPLRTFGAARFNAEAAAAAAANAAGRGRRVSAPLIKSGSVFF